jgi:hypothetical protein
MKCDEHAEQFAAAMAKIRRDREVEGRRFGAAQTQADTIAEIARGLRRIGIESLSLQDEMRRYLSSYVETVKKARAPAGSQPGGVRVPTSTQPAAMPQWLPAGIGRAVQSAIGARQSSACDSTDCAIAESVSKIIGK